uniref:Doublesex- and mab-3-related transcription factor 3 (inferred by orthology to a human protein) n=1 Tax=Strongyloides venezuelensis TaxID=75913 RepID=A0A0K0EVH0_STRVS
MAFYTSTDKNILPDESNLPLMFTGMKSDSETIQSLFPNNKVTKNVRKNQKLKQVIRDPMRRFYYCQRCINHNQKVLRKGHKNFCRYAECECNKCSMVSKRRFLNSKLHKKLVDRQVITTAVPKTNLPKERVPTCALCAVHGCKILLRGHRKIDCPYIGCKCELCVIVNNRRELMAKQIKLRRLQSNPKKYEKELKKLFGLMRLDNDTYKMGNFTFANIPKYVDLLSALQEISGSINTPNANDQMVGNNHHIQSKQNTLHLSGNMVNFTTSVPCPKILGTSSIISNTFFSQPLPTLQQFSFSNYDNNYQNQFKQTLPSIYNTLYPFYQNQLEPLHFMNNVMNNVFQSPSVLSNTLNFLPPVSEITQQTMTPMFGNMPQIFSQSLSIYNQGIQSNFNYLNFQNNPFLNNNHSGIRNLLTQQKFSPFNI